jgi:hypothetical protein
MNKSIEVYERVDGVVRAVTMPEALYEQHRLMGVVFLDPRDPEVLELQRLRALREQEQAAVLAKTAQKAALRGGEVTTSSGRVFDAGEASRNAMANQLATAGSFKKMFGGVDWKLANNTVQRVSLRELREALSLATERAGAIVTGAAAPESGGNHG